MRRDLTALADGFQFHLRDEGSAYAIPPEWPESARDDRVYPAPGSLGILAAKNWFVPVAIEVVEAAPTIDAEAWDHIVEATLQLPSGRLVLAGGPTPGRDQPPVDLTPGSWRALILMGNLDRTAIDAEGDDYYKVVLWPGGGDLVVRKRWMPRDA
jgi:hypothetical protein